MPTLYALEIPTQALRRGFWLYVWEIGQNGDATACYVGMTGDTGAGVAQSAINRLTAHLGTNRRSNALRRHLECRGTSPEECDTLKFTTYGPLYAELQEGYRTVRARVARLERELWAALSVAEFDMIHMQPRATAELDRATWEEVLQAFAEKIPQLRKLA